jgi:hypothetical protein
MYENHHNNRTIESGFQNGSVKLLGANHDRALNEDVRTRLGKPGLRNLLILGAAGHVAKAVFTRLGGRINRFDSVILLDRREPNKFLLERDNVRFVRQDLSFPRDTVNFRNLIRSGGVALVLDLTDMDTLHVLEATDHAGASYINTALNDARRGITALLERIHPHRNEPRRAPHILSSGMNPGVVNIWVWDGVQRFGTPEEILHFEYDDSTPKAGWQPIITWSRQEFLTETVWEPTGVVEGGDLKLFPTNALRNREDLREVLSPIVQLPEYPHGFTVLHEENLKLGRNLGASSRYVYAIHPKTMEYLVELYEKNGTVSLEDIQVADNTEIPLKGTDLIGVRLRYPDKDVYYVHRLRNDEVVETNATCAQVACGVEAALHTLATEALEPRVYFATDLYETNYSRWIFRNMRIERYVFERVNKRPGNLSAGRIERPYEHSGRSPRESMGATMERMSHVS